METYRGVKFRTRFLGGEILSNRRLEDIMGWCHIFKGLGLVPGCEGNASFRLRKHYGEFVVTCSGTDLGVLHPRDFSRVERVDFRNRIVYYYGGQDRKPSSESMIHWIIYQERPEVGAIFHGHGFINTESSRFPITEKEEPYGSLELANQVLSILANNDFLILRNHGFLSLGRTIEEAGGRVMEACVACPDY